MATGDRDFRLLLAIMKYLGENRDIHPNLVETSDLIELIPTERRNADRLKNMYMLDGYLRFLEQKGYVELGTPVLYDLKRWVRLTAAGEIFVQPELAQIDDPLILSQLVDAIEKQILTYPMDEGAREGFLFKFREAMARKAPDLAVKLLIEYLPKLLGGG